ncbi:MAG: DMT family transporter [Sphingomonas sp.]
MTAPAPDRILPAVTLRLLSVVFLATMSALIKLAEAHGAQFAEILFFRQAAGVPLIMAWIAAGPGLKSVATKRIGSHITRTAVGLSSMACLFAALMILPLAEATTFQFTVPIFATVLGALLLKEQTGWHRWGAVLVGFLGVLIVARPGSGNIPLAGAALGLTAATLTAVVSILLRQIGRTEGAATTVFWFATLSVPPLGLLYAFHLAPHPPEVWAMLVGIGMVGAAGQLALTGALKLGPVSLVVPMDYSSLLWATLYGWLLFGALPDATTWIGAPIIIGSGLYIVWREHVRRRIETDRAIV